MSIEIRTITQPVELRESADTQPVLAGYGATFERLSQNLGGFVEIIDPAAFDTTLSAKRNILSAFNHDPSQLLATVDSGTLTVGRDGTGIPYEILLDPTDPDALRVMAKVRTGKVKGSSFTFTTRQDSWGTTDQGFPLRRLLEVELHELGPVTNPAYLSTEEGEAQVALRSLSKFIDLPFEQVRQAAQVNELTDLILRDLGDDNLSVDESASGETVVDESVELTGRKHPLSR